MVLLKILRKIKRKEKEMRVLMLGLDNAGKTTVVKKFNGEDIDTISPTLGFNIQTLEYKTFKLNIWDVGGQVTIRSYWKNYYETSDGLIWVIDSADVRRLEDTRNELHALLKEEVLLCFDSKSPEMILSFVWSWSVAEIGRRFTVDLCQQTGFARRAQQR
jgi:ADP-ribosylation factor-like protein 2